MEIGERLLSVLSKAESSVRIAAPFIKVHSLERALSAIPEEVEVACVTRWRVEDIAGGVCDVEIFDHLQNRKHGTLLVHPHLHAKFFASDHACLVGSANLTHTALGWRSPSNLELLIELDAREHGLNDWWDGLVGSSIVATQEMKAALAHQADGLRLSGEFIPRPEADPENSNEGTIWAPQCPRWSGLWEAYVGDEDQMPASAMRSARKDLEALCIPPSLNEIEFGSALATFFRETSVFQEIEKLSKSSLTDATAHMMLQSLCTISAKEAPRRWQLIKNWLAALYPDEYRLETNQEVLLLGRTL